MMRESSQHLIPKAFIDREEIIREVTIISEGLSREPLQRLTSKEYIEREEAVSRISMRERAVTFFYRLR